MPASLRLFGNFDLSVEPPHARQSRSELHSALAKSELSTAGSLWLNFTPLFLVMAKSKRASPIPSPWPRCRVLLRHKQFAVNRKFFFIYIFIRLCLKHDFVHREDEVPPAIEEIKQKGSVFTLFNKIVIFKNL